MEERTLTVGEMQFKVYGESGKGWSVDPADFQQPVPTGARYASIDELYFALTNLSLAERAAA
ncbi:MAG TPA: hypothetical protein VL403_20720 [Candidatus Kryptonia bacterium]|nr:hypothetical protein [Candidatus Kryptonia bacterium]